MDPLPIGRDDDPFTLHSRDPARQMPLAVNRLRRDNRSQASDEPAAVVKMPQGAIKSRRRYLKRVGEIERDVDVENGAQILADPLTIRKANGLSSFVLTQCGSETAVEDYPQDPANRFATELHVEDLDSVAPRDSIRNRSNLVDLIFTAHAHVAPRLSGLRKHKKWA